MGLFDKKYCDICGEKIGLLGNRKLENGNLCKDCAKKLSPWFSERRSSTVDEIREQLDWREANRERAAQFRTTLSYGERTRLLLDETHRWFTVTRESSPANDNSDVLDFSVITGCRSDIDETRTELKMESRDNEGKPVYRSYNPPRYEYDYDFFITIFVNVPYYNEMKFQLNSSRVHIPYQPTSIRWTGSIFLEDRREEPLYDPCYRGLKETCDEICRLLESIRSGSVQGQRSAAPAQSGTICGISIPGVVPSPAVEQIVADTIKYSSWQCAACRFPNSGTAVCQHCGAPLSDENLLSNIRNLAYAASLADNAAQNAAPVQNSAPPQSWMCQYCGTVNQGNFCESCGAKRS